MTLPTTGSISASQINVELQRTSNNHFSVNNTTERSLAGKSSGQISLGDFRGKTFEYVRTLSAGGSDIHLQSLFSATEWNSTAPKRVILPAGVERGSSNVNQSAVHIGPNSWTGPLTLEVYGIISGAGGATGAAGGMALNANITGNTGQKMNLRVYQGGIIRGGGGGGGRGGNGGNGHYTSTSEDHPNNSTHASYSYYTWCTLNWNGWFNHRIRANVSGWNWRNYSNGYYSYPIVDNWWQDSNNQIFTGHQVGVQTNEYGDALSAVHVLWRRITHHHYTNGGAGGAGGRGQGYGQSSAGGAGGAAGGVNAGRGGNGGSGGGYGNWGATGNSGANGNNGNGAGGTGGAAPGFSIANIGNVNLTNNGTLQGRT